MLLELVGKNIDLKEGLKDQAQKKFSKLDKYFAEEVQARAVFSKQKNGQKVEVTIFLPGTILRAEETSQDMFVSIDKTVDKLERIRQDLKKDIKIMKQLGLIILTRNRRKKKKIKISKKEKHLL